jgi:hypothetical protein
VRVNEPERNWSAISRCLLADEVPRLAQWLESAAENDKAGRFDTLDNEINFEFLEAGRLRVCLESDFRPPQVQTTPRGEFFLDFPVTKRTLLQAASYFRQRLQVAAKESGKTQVE